MNSTLIDSNILLDVFDEESPWRSWSDGMLADCMRRGPVVINPLIFAEVATGFDSLDELERRLPEASIRREPLPFDAAFLAARAFLIYRHNGGERRSPLPDFYIGAHAAVAGHTLLTRDSRRYRYYFPKLRIIAP
jgi:predicted nucleic acid-binding protein